MPFYHKNVKFLLLLISFLFISGCQPMTNKPIKRWQQAVDSAYAGDISRDGQYSVISSIYHGISLWNLKTNTLIYQWSQKQNDVNNLVLLTKINDDNSYVVTANRTDFALWNIKTGKSEGFWRVRNSNIRDIAIADKGKYILIGKANGTVVHVTLATGRRLEFLGHHEKVNSVDMLPNGRVAISGGNDFVAYVWDTKSGQVIYRFNHPTRVSKVALDSKGRFAFTADSRKSAYIWDLKTGKLISSLKYTQRQEIFSSVRFSDDGKWLLTGAPTRKVSIWDVATGKRVASWSVTPKKANHPTGAVVYSVAFKDNNSVYTLSSSGYAELWQIPQ